MSPHDESKRGCPFGPELDRYWAKRHDIFSRWDEGIRSDPHGLYTAKPERLAFHLAESISGEIVIDGMCGIGGITIGLARTGHRVAAVDNDLKKLEMAQHNAGVYGVRDRIRFVHADIIEYLRQAQADVVVVDPDWGGPGYHYRDEIGLSDLCPDGRTLVAGGLKAAPVLVLCVPWNCGREELGAIRGARLQQIREWRMWNRTICVTAMFRRAEAINLPSRWTR